MRYNFHKQKDAVRDNPKHILPADINKPFEDWLSSIKCEIGRKKLIAMRDNVRYGEIELIDKRKPHAKITFEVSCGMSGTKKVYEIKEDENWLMTSYYTVRNQNIDKTKRKEATNE